MQPSDLPSTSVNTPYGLESFCKLPSTSVWPEDLALTFPMAGTPSVNFCQISVHPGKFPSTSVKFPRSQETFRQPPSILGEAGRPSVNFHLLSVWLGDISLTSVNFTCGRETFRHHLVQLVDLLSTFRAAWRPSVNFGQLSVWTEEDILCTSVNFTYSLKNFCRLPPTFPANGRSSVNFCQLSVRPGHFPLITKGLHAAQKVLRKLMEVHPPARKVDGS